MRSPRTCSPNGGRNWPSTRMTTCAASERKLEETRGRYRIVLASMRKAEASMTPRPGEVPRPGALPEAQPQRRRAELAQGQHARNRVRCDVAGQGDGSLHRRRRRLHRDAEVGYARTRAYLNGADIPQENRSADLRNSTELVEVRLTQIFAHQDRAPGALAPSSASSSAQICGNLRTNSLPLRPCRAGVPGTDSPIRTASPLRPAPFLRLGGLT